MKPGDIVKFKPNKCRAWGEIALVYKVARTDYGTGQIYVINSVLPGSTIPWCNRDSYMEVVVES